MRLTTTNRRAFSTEGFITLLTVLTVLALGGYLLWKRYYSSRQENPSGYLPQQPSPAINGDSPKEILEKLLEAIDQRDYSAVEAYAVRLFKDRADIYLDPAPSGLRDPVIRAAYEGDVQLFRALLVAKPVFGGSDDLGRRPIHIAAATNSPELIEWLLDQGVAEIDDPIEATGLTPLHVAAKAGSSEAIRILLERGANTQRLTALGRSSLHTAAEHGNAAAAITLLENMGIEDRAVLISMKDEDANTPLHLAARSGLIEVAVALLNAGADVTSKNQDGFTAADSAMENDHLDLAEIISP